MTKKVIIADDEPIWRDMYVSAIRDAFPAVQIDEVETGKDLVERILKGGYSVVISDNDMEGKGDGLRVLQEIRAHGNNVPFYLVSARGSAVEKTALESGANGFYKKAEFDSDKLVADITQYITK